jgi:hypothetical protein
MADWLPPLAAASLTVLFLDIAVFVQRARKRAEGWPTRCGAVRPEFHAPRLLPTAPGSRA